MQMLQSNWLSYRTLSAICVQWQNVVFKMATFSPFTKVSVENLEANG